MRVDVLTGAVDRSSTERRLLFRVEACLTLPRHELGEHVSRVRPLIHVYTRRQDILVRSFPPEGARTDIGATGLTCGDV